jgi:hypothetical protein
MWAVSLAREQFLSGRVTGKPEVIGSSFGLVPTNALVADDSSAQPDRPGDCGLVLSAVGGGSALPHESLTQPAVRGLRFRPGITSDWCGRIHYDVRLVPPGEKQITCCLQRRIG